MRTKSSGNFMAMQGHESI